MKKILLVSCVLACALAITACGGKKAAANSTLSSDTTDTIENESMSDDDLEETMDETKDALKAAKGALDTVNSLGTDTKKSLKAAGSALDAATKLNKAVEKADENSDDLQSQLDAANALLDSIGSN